VSRFDGPPSADLELADCSSGLPCSSEQKRRCSGPRLAHHPGLDIDVRGASSDLKLGIDKDIHNRYDSVVTCQDADMPERQRRPGRALRPRSLLAIPSSGSAAESCVGSYRAAAINTSRKHLGAQISRQVRIRALPAPADDHPQMPALTPAERLLVMAGRSRLAAAHRFYRARSCVRPIISSIPLREVCDRTSVGERAGDPRWEDEGCPPLPFLVLNARLVASTCGHSSGSCGTPNSCRAHAERSCA
jgi:hypothetical protein